MALGINDIPKSIPESKEKKVILDSAGKESIYLGQGIIPTPAESATDDYNKYITSQGFNPEDFPLSRVMKGPQEKIYNSAELAKVFSAMKPSIAELINNPQNFKTNIYDEVAGETMENLFQIDGKDIATMQANSLQEGLTHIRSIVATLKGEPVSKIILPEQFCYSGYDTDFAGNVMKNNSDFGIIRIPEVQEDGSQNLEKMREQFESVKNEGRISFIIDQPHNNNSSGWDRNPEINEEFVSLLKEYEGVVFYVGDVAYKGMKEDLREEYPLMQELLKQDVTAFWHFSPSKIGNYRGDPSNMNTIFATPGDFANTDTLKKSFKECSRSAGLGCSQTGAELMNALSTNPEFEKEVKTLKLYLEYVRASLGLENVNGMFANVTPEQAEILNSGDIQAVTVGTRIALPPLGDPKKLEIYKNALEQ